LIASRSSGRESAHSYTDPGSQSELTPAATVRSPSAWRQTDDVALAAPWHGHPARGLWQHAQATFHGHHACKIDYEPVTLFSAGGLPPQPLRSGQSVSGHPAVHHVVNRTPVLAAPPSRHGGIPHRVEARRAISSTVN
jgi:hypothetical protein